MTPLRVDGLATSHPGLVRTANEDSFCDRGADGVWAVADGMGGHAHGDWASGALAEALAAAALPAGLEPAAGAVADAIHAANARIRQEASRRGAQMGSTVVALVVRDARFAVLWVGDSRAYLLRGGRLIQLSRDHTEVQEMVDRGLLRPDDARTHPRGHVLARAVGVRDALEVDAVADEVEPGDLFLLCSDGLTGEVADAEIAAVLAGVEGGGTGKQAALDRLVALVLERGARDNVTAVIVTAQEATALSFAGAPGGFP
jgi:serine/threonine-protein phosphatase Stp1